MCLRNALWCNPRLSSVDSEIFSGIASAKASNLFPMIHPRLQRVRRTSPAPIAARSNVQTYGYDDFNGNIVELTSS